MSSERQRRRNSSASDEFDISLMYDDIEKIREIEEEEEKDQNNKLSFAGMMSLIAGGLLLASGALAGLGIINEQIFGFLFAAFIVVGFGALGYGFYKTLKLAFREKELRFPALNVYKKTKPIVEEAKTKTSQKTKTQDNTQRERARAQARYRRRPMSTMYGGRKTLMRSLTNRVFSGVAAGLAEYMGVSATLVRFAFIASLVTLFPLPIFLYLLLSIILPTDYVSEFQERGNSNVRTS